MKHKTPEAELERKEKCEYYSLQLQHWQFVSCGLDSWRPSALLDSRWGDSISACSCWPWQSLHKEWSVASEWGPVTVISQINQNVCLQEAALWKGQSLWKRSKVFLIYLEWKSSSHLILAMNDALNQQLCCTCLESNYKNFHESEALGINKILCKFLKNIAKLSKALQSKQLELTLVSTLADATL